MPPQAVSSDPGSAYLNGLTAEFEAAHEVLSAWVASRARLVVGLERWSADESEIGRRNADRYREDLARVTRRIERISAARDIIWQEIAVQQAENLADYEDRVRQGFAK